MSEEEIKKHRHAYASIKYHSQIGIRESEMDAFEDGIRVAYRNIHSKIEEAEREAYNRACNNIIDMISDSSAFGLVDANGTIEKIEKLRK